MPLIAVRRKHEKMEGDEEFYPDDLSFPVTAFLRVKVDTTTNAANRHAVLELYDPLNQPEIEVASTTVSLETDLSTPLAHTLSQPALDDSRLSTLGLLKPEQAAEVRGLYMLEPFQPDKIPVVMVHGLWSSPVTWMEMFNDLRSDPQVREHYQFWFYMYPTGQPFWYSAAEMREDMEHVRQVVDPRNEKSGARPDDTRRPQHGRLVSKLQTVDSGNEFWNTAERTPIYRSPSR